MRQRQDRLAVPTSSSLPSGFTGTGSRWPGSPGGSARLPALAGAAGPHHAAAVHGAARGPRPQAAGAQAPVRYRPPPAALQELPRQGPAAGARGGEGQRCWQLNLACREAARRTTGAVNNAPRALWVRSTTRRARSGCGQQRPSRAASPPALRPLPRGAPPAHPPSCRLPTCCCCGWAPCLSRCSRQR